MLDEYNEMDEGEIPDEDLDSLEEEDEETF